MAFFAFFHALRNTWATNELRLSMAVRSHECLFRSAVLFCPQNYILAGWAVGKTKLKRSESEQ